MISRLRDEVLERYASVYAFCRAHPELKRATVYLVLSGRYPGKVEAQVVKIRAALHGTPPADCAGPGVTREGAVEALQEIRCGNCRRLDRRACGECRAQTEREARELYSRLFPGR